MARLAAALTAACLTLSPATAIAQSMDDPRSMVRLAGPDHEPPAASLEDVAWLLGYWVGGMPEGPVEQVFLPPSAGQLPSFVRATNEDGDIIFYEISNIVEKDGSLTIQLRHFTPELVGWEDSSGAIERPLIAVEDGNLYFHRASFIRTGEDAYTVFFLNMDGEEELDTLVVPFERVALPAAG